jgi:hypothetical protein
MSALNNLVEWACNYTTIALAMGLAQASNQGLELGWIVLEELRQVDVGIEVGVLVRIAWIFLLED